MLGELRRLDNLTEGVNGEEKNGWELATISGYQAERLERSLKPCARPTKKKTQVYEPSRAMYNNKAGRKQGK